MRRGWSVSCPAHTASLGPIPRPMDMHTVDGMHAGDQSVRGGSFTMWELDFFAPQSETRHCETTRIVVVGGRQSGGGSESSGQMSELGVGGP